MSRACFALLSFGEQCTERSVSIHFQQPGPTLASTGRGIRARPASGRAAACNTPTPITHARLAYWLAARERLRDQFCSHGIERDIARRRDQVGLIKRHLGEP